MKYILEPVAKYLLLPIYNLIGIPFRFAIFLLLILGLILLALALFIISILRFSWNLSYKEEYELFSDNLKDLYDDSVINALISCFVRRYYNTSSEKWHRYSFIHLLTSRVSKKDQLKFVRETSIDDLIEEIFQFWK